MQTQIRVRKLDILWNYIGTIANLSANLILVPILLFFLNNEEYGMWSIFVTIGGITTLFDFGFNVTFARNVTYCWSGVRELHKDTVEYSSNAEPNFVLLKQVYETCRIVYLGISLLALLLIGTLGTVYVKKIWIGQGLINILVAWGIYLFAIFCNLYYGYYDALLRGVGAISELNKSKVISRGCQILITIILMSLGGGLIGASIGYCAYGIVFRLLAKVYFFKGNNIGDKLSVIHRPGKDSIRKIIKIVWYNAWKDGIVQMANYLSNQVTVIMASIYMPLAVIGGYSLAIQISQAIVTMASVVHNTYQPTMQSAVVNREEERIRSIFSFVICSFAIVSVVGGGFLLIIGIPVLRHFRPLLVLDFGIYVGALIYQFLLKGRNCYTAYLASTNRIIYYKSFLVSGILSVIFSFLFIQILGKSLWALILGQILSQLVFNAWYWPRFVHKELGLKIYEIPQRAFDEFGSIIKKNIR